MRITFGAFVCVAFLAGCAQPESPKVFVDLDQLVTQIQAARPEQIQSPSGKISASSSISGVASETLFLGLSEAELSNVQSKAAKSQDAAIQRIFDQRLAVLDGQVESDVSRLRRELEGTHRAILDQAFLELRGPFERIAQRVGDLSLELTSLIAFPDDGQDATGFNEVQRKQRQDRAEEIRSELKRLDREYQDERDAILGRATELIAEDLRAIARKSELNRKEQITALLNNLENLRSQAKAQASLNPRVKRVYALPGESAKSLIVTGEVAKTTAPVPGEAYRSPRWIAREKAKIFASLRGYTLVNKSAAEHDATKECIAWLKEYWAGSSAKSPKSSKGP